jgi:hypothetical protein
LQVTELQIQEVHGTELHMDQKISCFEEVIKVPHGVHNKFIRNILYILSTRNQISFVEYPTIASTTEQEAITISVAILAIPTEKEAALAITDKYIIIIISISIILNLLIFKKKNDINEKKIGD